MDQHHINRDLGGGASSLNLHVFLNVSTSSWVFNKEWFS